MDFSHLLHSSILQQDKLIQFGFSKSDDIFTIRRDLNSDLGVTTGSKPAYFYALIQISSEKITAQVYETETDERYVLLDVPSAQGAFVNGLREQLRNLMEEIYTNCFLIQDLKEMYVQWIREELRVEGDFPWEDDNTSAVYRCDNGKWFALIMHIKFKNLGFQSDEPVWAVNLKADADKIPSLVDEKSIFPAWHMNKKHWITVVLTAVTDFEKLKSLTVRSKELVSGSR